MVDITKFNTNLKSYITTTAFTVAITPNLIKTGGMYVIVLRTMIQQPILILLILNYHEFFSHSNFFNEKKQNNCK